MQFTSSPANMIHSLVRNRRLIYSLGSREVLGRYRGSILGILWSFVNPVFMLIVYTFVFSVVFKARWNYGSESKAEFALLLFSGLIIFNFFAECINRSPNLIPSHANYVKKMVFPLETLPWAVMMGAFFHAIISVGVWILAHLLLIGAPSITIVYLPLIFFPLMLIVIGLSWFLAALGVYLRDVSQVVGVLTTALLFMSPIFYPLSALPEKYHLYLLLNPLTAIVEQSRAVMYWGQNPNWELLAFYYLISGIVAWLGFMWFQNTRKGFADVL